MLTKPVALQLEGREARGALVSRPFFALCLSPNSGGGSFSGLCNMRLCANRLYLRFWPHFCAYSRAQRGLRISCPGSAVSLFFRPLKQGSGGGGNGREGRGNQPGACTARECLPEHRLLSHSCSELEASFDDKFPAARSSSPKIGVLYIPYFNLSLNIGFRESTVKKVAI